VNEWRIVEKQIDVNTPAAEHRPDHRILIASRDGALRQALGWLLSDEPELHVVSEAISAIDALTQAKALEPDVVILDTDLPEADGYTVTRVLKRLPTPPFVILLLVQADPTARLRGKEAGADGYFEKGTDWPDLLAQIRGLLGMGGG
jgi:DNA-binding NarL/FixJ family response regulator